MKSRTINPILDSTKLMMILIINDCYIIDKSLAIKQVYGHFIDRKCHDETVTLWLELSLAVASQSLLPMHILLAFCIVMDLCSIQGCANWGAWGTLRPPIFSNLQESCSKGSHAARELATELSVTLFVFFQ